MSGDRPAIQLDAPPGSVLARAVEALGRFPAEPVWAVVGGIAVFIRLGSVTRPTADADTVARSQAELLDRLVADDVATIVSGGELEVPIGDGRVEVDVMDLADDPLPGDSERRAFALARRYALDTAVREPVVVSDGADVVVEARIPVATTGALVALKTVSMVRRPHGSSPRKVGSDIHDLVRLVAGAGARKLAAGLAADAELGAWVAEQVGRAFGADLRYTLIRLRSNDRSAGAQAADRRPGRSHRRPGRRARRGARAAVAIGHERCHERRKHETPGPPAAHGGRPDCRLSDPPLRSGGGRARTKPAVAQQMELVLDLQTDEWWADVTVPMLEQARRRLRTLIPYIEAKRRKPLYTDIVDTIGEGREIALSGLAGADDFERFRRKTREYLRDPGDLLAVEKLRRNRPTTATDLDEIQRVLIEAGIGTDGDLERASEQSGGFEVSSADAGDAWASGCRRRFSGWSGGWRAVRSWA